MASGIRTNAAAEILGVSPNTLRSWERRFGYPEPERSGGNHRQYNLVDLQTLRDALDETGNISSAIGLARQRQSAPASGDTLDAALSAFDESAADRAMEESMAIRPLERTVEELLLPAIERLSESSGEGAEAEFASRWATGWLHGARRMAPAASRPAGVLLLDSTSGRDPESVYVQALDLALRRAGFRVLAFSSEMAERRIESAVSALEPTAIIMCGPRGGRFEEMFEKVRAAGAGAPVYGYRAGELGAEVPSAGDRPSEVTAMLNADLRRRAAQAFA